MRPRSQMPSRDPDADPSVAHGANLTAPSRRPQLNPWRHSPGLPTTRSTPTIVRIYLITTTTVVTVIIFTSPITRGCLSLTTTAVPCSPRPSKPNPSKPDRDTSTYRHLAGRGLSLPYWAHRVWVVHTRGRHHPAGELRRAHRFPHSPVDPTEAVRSEKATRQGDESRADPVNTRVGETVYPSGAPDSVQISMNGNPIASATDDDPEKPHHHHHHRPMTPHLSHPSLPGLAQHEPAWFHKPPGYLVRLKNFAFAEVKSISDQLHTPGSLTQLVRAVLVFSLSTLLVLVHAIAQWMGPYAYLLPFSTIFLATAPTFGAHLESIGLAYAALALAFGYTWLGRFAAQECNEHFLASGDHGGRAILAVWLFLGIFFSSLLRVHDKRYYIPSILFALPLVFCLTSQVDRTTDSLGYTWSFIKPLIFGTSFAAVVAAAFFPVSATFNLEKCVLLVMCRVMKVLDTTTKSFLLEDANSLLTAQEFNAQMGQVRAAMAGLKQTFLEAKYEISYSNHKPEDFAAIQLTLLKISQHLGSMTLSAQNERFLIHAQHFLDNGGTESCLPTASPHDTDDYFSGHHHDPEAQGFLTSTLGMTRDASHRASGDLPDYLQTPLEESSRAPSIGSVRTARSHVPDHPPPARPSALIVTKELEKADRAVFLHLLRTFGPSIHELSYLCELTLDRCVHQFIKNCHHLARSSAMPRMINEVPTNLLIHNYSVIEARYQKHGTDQSRGFLANLYHKVLNWKRAPAGSKARDPVTKSRDTAAATVPASGTPRPSRPGSVDEPFHSLHSRRLSQLFTPTMDAAVPPAQSRAASIESRLSRDASATRPAAPSTVPPRPSADGTDPLACPIRSNDPLSDPDMAAFVHQIQLAIARFDALEISTISKAYHVNNVVDRNLSYSSLRDELVSDAFQDSQQNLALIDFEEPREEAFLIFFFLFSLREIAVLLSTMVSQIHALQLSRSRSKRLWLRWNSDVRWLLGLVRQRVRHVAKIPVRDYESDAGGRRTPGGGTRARGRPNRPQRTPQERRRLRRQDRDKEFGKLPPGHPEARSGSAQSATNEPMGMVTGVAGASGLRRRGAPANRGELYQDYQEAVRQVFEENIDDTDSETESTSPYTTEGESQQPRTAGTPAPGNRWAQVWRAVTFGWLGQSATPDSSLPTMGKSPAALEAAHQPVPTDEFVAPTIRVNSATTGSIPASDAPSDPSTGAADPPLQQQHPRYHHEGQGSGQIRFGQLPRPTHSYRSLHPNPNAGRRNTASRRRSIDTISSEADGTDSDHDDHFETLESLARRNRLRRRSNTSFLSVNTAAAASQGTLPMAQTRWRRFLYRLWLLSRWLKSYKVLYSFKLAVAITMICLPAYFDSSLTFYSTQRMSWMAITTTIVLSPTIGRTLVMSIYRVVGVVYASICCLIGWYMTQQNAYGLFFVGMVTSIPGFYIVIFTPHKSVGYLAVIIFVITIYSLYTKISVDDTILTLVYKRLWTSVAGLLIALLVNIWLWPRIARVELRRFTAFGLDQLGTIFSKLVARLVIHPLLNPENNFFKLYLEHLQDPEADDDNHLLPAPAAGSLRAPSANNLRRESNDDYAASRHHLAVLGTSTVDLDDFENPTASIHRTQTRHHYLSQPSPSRPRMSSSLAYEAMLRNASDTVRSGDNPLRVIHTARADLSAAAPPAGAIPEATPQATRPASIADISFHPSHDDDIAEAPRPGGSSTSYQQDNDGEGGGNNFMSHILPSAIARDNRYPFASFPPPASVLKAHAKLNDGLNKSIRKMQDLLVRSRVMLQEAQLEPRFRGPFPFPAYTEILDRLQNILDRVISMSVSTNYISPRVHNAIITPFNHHGRRDMTAAILMNFYALAGALRSKTPLPPYLPSARAARLRLINQIRRHLKAHQPSANSSQLTAINGGGYAGGGPGTDPEPPFYTDHLDDWTFDHPRSRQVRGHGSDTLRPSSSVATITPTASQSGPPRRSLQSDRELPQGNGGADERPYRRTPTWSAGHFRDAKTHRSSGQLPLRPYSTADLTGHLDSPSCRGRRESAVRQRQRRRDRYQPNQHSHLVPLECISHSESDSHDDIPHHGSDDEGRDTGDDEEEEEADGGGGGGAGLFMRQDRSTTQPSPRRPPAVPQGATKAPVPTMFNGKPLASTVPMSDNNHVPPPPHMPVRRPSLYNMTIGRPGYLLSTFYWYAYSAAIEEVIEEVEHLVILVKSIVGENDELHELLDLPDW
ncbi:hypothetical protein IWQ60_010090 [Tieghemiomyces parasiticus]|uniref:ER transporter 6TM N-terminal domain-containing protein n=1 Tax=Tieghemiomyces parasiticus TaxID=78921 RepID=A0A9W7ZRU5_9FUNG|nr:hypothetical protein IWQ60_010090 [Tieghemiomyces parasiticus]